MAYVSPSASAFFMFKDAMVQLRVTGGMFFRKLVVINTAETHQISEQCLKLFGRFERTPPPDRHEKLPFKFKPENKEQMMKWMQDRYASFRFNQIPHKPLPCI